MIRQLRRTLRLEARFAAAMVVVMISIAASSLHGQDRTGPRILLGAGVAGQRDADRDLGTPGVTADVGVTWVIRRTLRARLSATAFLIPGGQGCSCDPDDPPPSIQSSVGFLAAMHTVPRDRPLYVLAGAGYRWGGFQSLDEHQSMAFTAGLGWAFGATRRIALEARYDHFLRALGATRALVPVYLTWRL